MQPPFIEFKGFLMRCLTELTCQNVCPNHRQRRTLTSQKRWAKSRVAYQADPTTRPGVHADLAYAIKINVTTRFHCRQNPRTFPSGLREFGAQDVFMIGRLVLEIAALRIREYKQEHCPIVMHR